jgi:hypothetical protein
MSTNKPIRFIAVGDNHGDMVDEESFLAVQQFIKDYKPTVRVHLGDCFDFRSLRRGVGNDAESAESLKADTEAGIAFLNMIKPTVYLWGNHEARLDNFITNSGSAIHRDYAQDLKDKINQAARKAGAKIILPYHADKGIYRLGPVAFGHGYSHGTNAVTQQGVHYADMGGGFICGHVHRLEQVNLQKHGGGAAYSAGCLCRTSEMLYSSMRLATSRHGLGFAYGYVAGSDWKVWLAHKVGDNWVWQSDLNIWSPKTK